MATTWTRGRSRYPVTTQWPWSHHAELLEEAGLIKGEVVRAIRQGTIGVRIERLTCAGHEFLDAARNETVWQRFKQVVRERGVAVPFEVLPRLLMDLAQKHLLG